MQKAFLVDSSICLGCNTCAMACKNQYHQDNGIAWRMVREIGGEEYREDQNNILPTVTWYAKAPKAHMPEERYYFSLACNHCENPACVEVCPASAQVKDPITGIVKHDQELCIGCKGCVLACPFGASKYNERLGKSEKCSMCWERQDEGLQPACIQSCPTGSIALIDIHDPASAKLGTTDPLGIDYAIGSSTEPSTRFVHPSLPAKMHRL